MFEIALSDKTGVVDWYSVDPNLYNNPGASGMFLINFKNRSFFDPDKDRDNIQKKLRVASSRFDEIGCSTPNLIVIDAEGAEFKILNGFGAKLKRVDAVILETSFSVNRIGQELFPKIDKLLCQYGFEFFLAKRDGAILTTKPRPKFLTAFLGRFENNFDVLYLRK